MQRVLFISPHLDDAVLSCTGAIIRYRQTGIEPYVVTLFSGPTTDPHYLMRRKEDENALQLLNIQWIYLDALDAPYRRKDYHNVSTLLFHHQVPPLEQDLVQTMSLWLQELLLDLHPERVFFPLGVGGHIDHHVTFASSLLLHHLSIPFTYYEELPYALLPGWNSVRLWQLQAKPGSCSSSPLQKIPLPQVPCFFLHHYLRSQEDQAASQILYDLEWDIPLNANPSTWSFQEKTLAPSSLSLSHKELRQKCQAVLCYTTEWPSLFGPKAASLKQALPTESYWNYL